MAERSVDFKVPDEDASTKRDSTSGSKRAGRRSSFFQKLSRSFRKSGGERGADVETLRGTHGADFEGVALVGRGGGGGGCGCFGGGGDGKERFLLIKGAFCFVFKNEDATAPKFAIKLAHLTATDRGASYGTHLSVVTLESSLGDREYEFSFSESSRATEFVKAANKQAGKGEAQEVKERLGHAHLYQKSKSIKYAEKIALDKVNDQPEKEEKLTVQDMERMNPILGC